MDVNTGTLWVCVPVNGTLVDVSTPCFEVCCACEHRYTVEVCVPVNGTLVDVSTPCFEVCRGCEHRYIVEVCVPCDGLCWRKLLKTLLYNEIFRTILKLFFNEKKGELILGLVKYLLVTNKILYYEK